MLNTDLDAWKQVRAGFPGSIFGCGFRPRWIRRGPRDNAEVSRGPHSARLRCNVCVLGTLVMEESIELGSTDLGPVTRCLDEDRAV